MASIWWQRAFDPLSVLLRIGGHGRLLKATGTTGRVYLDQVSPHGTMWKGLVSLMSSLLGHVSLRGQIEFSEPRLPLRWKDPILGAVDAGSRCAADGPVPDYGFDTGQCCVLGLGPILGRAVLARCAGMGIEQLGGAGMESSLPEEIPIDAASAESAHLRM